MNPQFAKNHIELEKLVHDIKSPLMALKILSESLSELPEKKQRFLKMTIDRINSIVSDLDRDQEINRVEKVKIAPLLMDLIHEKKFEYSHRNIEFNLILDAQISKRYIFAHENSVLRNLSNLINNAVEAIDFKHSGDIQVFCGLKADHLVIKIVDNGVGISQENIKHVGELGFTFGKKNGSGLGLFHAVNYFEQINGHVAICSKENFGTTVSIELPQFEA